MPPLLCFCVSGAVTSSSVIPPCGENNSSLYFEKDRTPSSSGMELCEAEAAASAIAVAAITSDETTGNTGSVTPAETQNYGGTSGNSYLLSVVFVHFSQMVICCLT